MFKRRRPRYKSKEKKQQNNNFLVIFLSLIVLFETILLLSFLPQKKVSNVSNISKEKIKVETKKNVLKQPLTKKTITNQGKKTLAKLSIIPQITKKVPTKTRGKIAIVIDDWGYSTDNLDILRGIKSPLTLAILPFRDYSRTIAEFGYKNNYEVIIHMPMEPESKDSLGLEPETLMTHMKAKTIKSILNDAFDNIPYAKGINNHMGSLATQDEKFLSIIFRELKKKNFYFLDSLSSSKSVANRISKKIGIKFTKRSIFLDNDLNPQHIRTQLLELAKRADKDGKAIGIGHDRTATLSVLKEEIPKLAEQGYEFVFVSELLE